MSIHFLCPIRMKPQPLVDDGFKYWSRFCSGFPRSFLFLLDRHGFSDKFVNTVHNSNPRYGLILKQRLNLNFNTVSSVATANFYVRDWAGSYALLWTHSLIRCSLLDLEAIRKFSCIKIDFLFLLVTEEHGSIVQSRPSSSLFRSTIWITSGPLVVFFVFFFKFSLIFLQQVSRRSSSAWTSATEKLNKNFLFRRIFCNRSPWSFLIFGQFFDQVCSLLRKDGAD